MAWWKSVEEISPTYTVLAHFSILEDRTNHSQKNETAPHRQCAIEDAKICQAIKKNPNYQQFAKQNMFCR